MQFQYSTDFIPYKLITIFLFVVYSNIPSPICGFFLKITNYTIHDIIEFSVPIIEKPLEIHEWNLTCLRRITVDPLKIICLFTFLVCQKIKSPNPTRKIWRALSKY